MKVNNNAVIRGQTPNSLDRFSREGTLKALEFLQRLDSYGVAWKSFTEQYLDSTAMFRDVVIAILARSRSKTCGSSGPFLQFAACNQFSAQFEPACIVQHEKANCCASRCRDTFNVRSENESGWPIRRAGDERERLSLRSQSRCPLDWAPSEDCSGDMQGPNYRPHRSRRVVWR
jgi:hypothetical protein